MSDKTIDLANEIGELLSNKELDHVIPALTMVLSHAVAMSGISTDSMMEFIERAIKLHDDDSTTRH
jgi:hypothetical protein